MSLEICEVKNPEKLKLKNSIFFKRRVKLIMEPNAECKFIRISEDLYSKQQKVYFPLFENMIFCSAFYRRSDYDKTDGYNENMREGLEDWD